MKADSPDAIESLKEGSVRSVICTGDNELTGIAIGRLCGVVTTDICLRGTMENGKLVWNDPDNEGRGVSPDYPDPHCQLALTCSAWRYLYEQKQDLEHLWGRCVVFARMKPDDKINVVKYLQGRGLVVGMAGDGGNDCGGLRSSDQLSEGLWNEGAAKNDISLTTVPDLIREGRACLATNMATFTYFMVYAFLLTTLRTFYIVFLNLSLGEPESPALARIGLGFPMFFMTQSWAKPKLAKYRPTATLLGLRTISGVMVPYGLGCILLALLTVILHSNAWYDPLNPSWIHVLAKDWMKKGDNYDSAIGVLILFIVLSTTAYVNTYGGDFRRAICRNVGINIMYALFLFLVFFMTLSKPNELNCIYRVNCDTQSSLACKNIPVLSQLSVGGTGGCFLGVQETDSHPDYVPPDPDHPWWQPLPEKDCLPPGSTLAKIPLNSTTISTGKGFKVVDDCIGPNNCYSWHFKWLLAVCLAVIRGHGIVPDRELRLVLSHLCGLIGRLATHDWFTSRISVCSLFSAALPKVGEAKKQELLKKYYTLCGDDTPMVRRQPCLFACAQWPMAGTASGALSAAGRTLVAGTGAGTLQKEAHTLKEGEQSVAVLREKLRDLEKELEGALRPRMRQCNEDATGSRQRCEDLREAISRLGEARAKAAEEADLN
eukprot:s943_g12.t1